MPVTYCSEWNSLLRKPRDPYSEAAARRRHQRGQLYTALFGDPQAPRSLVQVRLETQWVGLTVLDPKSLHPWRMWTFDGAPSNECFFLKKYHSFHFDEEGAKRYADLVYFGMDGLLKVEEVDLVSKELYSYNMRADVADMWTAAPTFGEYESITRFETLDPFAALPRDAPWSKEWAQS